MSMPSLQWSARSSRNLTGIRFKVVATLVTLLGATAGCMSQPTSPASFEPGSPSETPGLITRHGFREALEDGWHFRNDVPMEENFQLGEKDGDGYGQANYTTSLEPGSGPIQLRRSWNEVEEVTVRMRWQVSPNMKYQTGSGVKKIWYLESPIANPIVLALVGDYGMAIITQGTAESGDGAVRIQGGRIEAGRIYDLEVYVKLNSVTAEGKSKPNGIATVRLDGQRIIHRTDLRFRGEDSPLASTERYFRATDGITGLRWNPTWPGGGDAPVEPMWERLYDIKVSRGAAG